MRIRTLPLLTLAWTLAACAVGPDYRKPGIATPDAFAEQARTPGAVADEADLARWWAQLQDPELDALVERAMAQNLDVATAASRLREARDQVTVARSALLPQVNGSAVAGRRDAQSGTGGSGGASEGGPGGGSSSSQGLALPRHLDLYSLGVDATWELDLFGGVRRGVEAASAQAQAAQWQGRDVQVALSAEIARAYLALRLAQARQAQAREDIARLRDLLDLVAARSRAGVVTGLDVNQQRSALQARLVQTPQLDQQARSAVHALAALLDEPIPKLEAELAPTGAQPTPPSALPVGLPSQLLQRRPDVRVAERRLAAATAQVGVAVADRFPKVNLIGLASFAGTEFAELLSTRNFSTIAGGMGSFSLFDAGRGRANVAARKEQAQQAELAYRQSVLTAFREVEDALAAYAADRARAARVAESLATARDTAALAQSRYGAGLTSFIDVLQARGAVQAASDQALEARNAELGDLVALFTALGGGWRDETG